MVYLLFMMMIVMIGKKKISRRVKGRYIIMNTEVEKFTDYLIEWIISKCDIELDRLTEFNIIRVIVDCVEMYENEKLREQK